MPEPSIKGTIMDKMTLAQSHLDAVIRQGMARHQTPAVTAAWTDREKLLYLGAWGHADPEKGIALAADHLFNFGSIGKSFTCIALLNAEENGLLDLQAPVTTYLPWFAVQTAYRPITLHDLMTHSSGLPRGTDQETEALGEVWNLRYLHTGFPPGEAFYYSNSGYKTLGLVLEKVYAMPYPHIIQRQILDPLGMTHTVPALTCDVRPRFARAYQPLCDDRPNRLDTPLVPAPWIESATGDGCVSSNAEDLAIYARMLLNRGLGENGRIFSEESFEKMITPYQQRVEDKAYGYGMMVWEEGGCHCIGHSGSIPGYLAFLRLDLQNGFGALLLMTDPASEEIEGVLLKTLRAGMLGTELPENPFERGLLAVEKPDDYTGRYQSAERAFEIRKDEERLLMAYEDEMVHLEPRREDGFLVYHPDFERFLLRFARLEGAQSPVVEAFYGGEWFRKEGVSGQAVFETPAEWLAYPGHYRSHNPWSANFRIVLRKGRLFLIEPQGKESHLRPLEDGSFLVEDEGDVVHVERLVFEGLVDGKAVIARLGGADHYRFFTP